MSKNFRVPAASGTLTVEDVISQAAKTVEGFAGDLAVVQNDIASLRNMQGLTERPRGPVDFEAIGSFVKAAVAHRTGARDLLEKVAAPWEISTDARGGFLVPVTVQQQIDAAMRPYGSLLAATQYTTVEPGRTHRIPAWSKPPEAAWQLEELDPLTEFDIEISGLDRAPRAVGGYVDLSWQLFHQSAFAVGQAIVSEVINANRQAIETGLVAGQVGVDSPADGLLEMAGTYSQTAMATATSALLSKFVGESLSDNPSLWDRGLLILAPDVAETIAAEEGASSYRGRFQIDDRGVMRFGRWPLAVTPAAGMNALLVDPAHLHVVSHGTTLIVDDKGGAKTLQVTMAIAGWANFGVSLAGSVSKCVVSALS